MRGSDGRDGRGAVGSGYAGLPVDRTKRYFEAIFSQVR